MKFLKGVKSELKKVKWPEKKYMIKYTVITIVLTVFMALYFFGIVALIGLIRGAK